MKNKNIFRQTILLGLLSVALVGCDSGFTAMNDNPWSDELTEIKPEEGDYSGLSLGDKIEATELAQLKGIESSLGNLFYNFSYEGMYDDYQKTTSLTHDIYAGYFSNGKADFVSSAPAYAYTDGWSAVRWSHFYAKRYTTEYAKLVRAFWFLEKPDGSGNNHADNKYLNAFYITRIHFAYLLSQMVDTYGAIPCQRFVKGLPTSGNAKFDKEEDVYEIIFRLLEEAAFNIKPGLCAYNLGTNDVCYGGDEAKWVRFANSLRLRLALRIANVDPTKAKDEAAKAIMHRGQLLQSNDDNYVVVPKYAPTALGGLDSGGSENVTAMCCFIYNGDVVMSKDIETYYKNQSSILDPRCEVQWFRPSPRAILSLGQEDTGNYNGCPLGDASNVGSDGTIYSLVKSHPAKSKELIDTHWFTYARPSVWFGYAEVKFLLAEAVLRGWHTGNVETLFKEGIEASMDYHHISGAKATQYINGLNIYNGGANPFASGSREEQLKELMVQKWLALFPNGSEAWAEFRRTGYPKLTPSLVSNDASIDPSKGQFIKRIQYPFNELQLNPDAPAGLTQGTRIWWDVEDDTDNPNNFR